MGAKKLKAIVVGGDMKIDPAYPDEFKRLSKTAARTMAGAGHLENLRKYGTPNLMDSLWALRGIPVKNWRLRSWPEGCKALGGKRIAEITRKHTPCYRCTLACTPYVEIKEGNFKMRGPSAEYESLAALGTLCLIDDVEAVIYANNLCNLYGIDTISTGAAVAFAMEAAEKGLISPRVDGITLNWGNAAAMVKLVELIGKNEGLGSILGLGTGRAAGIIGHGAADFAVTVNGMEVALHDPRSYFSMAGTYAAGPRGACHLHGMSMIFEGKEAPLPEWGLDSFYPPDTNENKGLLVKAGQDLAAVLNSLVVCYFCSFCLSITHFAQAVSLVTGEEHDPSSLQIIGERINEAQRAYNILCRGGAFIEHLPKRIAVPAEDDPDGTTVADVKTILSDFYGLRGWTENGVPTAASLNRLGLDDLIKPVGRVNNAGGN